MVSHDDVAGAQLLVEEGDGPGVLLVHPGLEVLDDGEIGQRMLESFIDGGAREPQRCPQEVQPEKFGARAVEPDKIGVLGLRLPREVEHAAAVRAVEFVVAVNVHDGGVAESPAQQRERRGDTLRNGDVAGKHQHVDAGWVE